MIESGALDTGFPIEDSREAAESVRKGYVVAGAPGRFSFDESTSGHRWNGAKSYEWIRRWL
jgi:hypothetical protein